MYSWADVLISCGQAATSNAGDATDDADLEQFGNSLVLHVLQHRINRTIAHAPNLIALANLIARDQKQFLFHLKTPPTIQRNPHRIK